MEKDNTFKREYSYTQASLKAESVSITYSNVKAGKHEVYIRRGKIQMAGVFGPATHMCTVPTHRPRENICQSVQSL